MPSPDAPPTGPAFPVLSESEWRVIRPLGAREVVADGTRVIAPGDTDVDFFVVEQGALVISSGDTSEACIAVHGPGEFAGDTDLLTRRAAVVSVRARGREGEACVLWRVPSARLRRLLQNAPTLSDKLLTAFQSRREALERSQCAGLRVVGASTSAPTMLLSEFLHKNAVPFVRVDPPPEPAPARAAAPSSLPGASAQPDPGAPVVITPAGKRLVAPSLIDLARVVGIRRELPDRLFDLAVVGAGPAGLAAAVYAASEGLSTLVLDRVGPGGQAGGSSLIENFIGFPGGLSGRELGLRGLLQMLKFGAALAVPFEVQSLETGGDHHLLLGREGERARARCVLAATGVRWKRLPARGAVRFERAGVFYTATAVEAGACGDEHEPVVVVGGGNSAGQAAMFLSACQRPVHLVLHGEAPSKGMSAYLWKRIAATKGITLHEYSEVVEVIGDERVRAVRIAPAPREGEQPQATTLPSTEHREIACSAVFVFIGSDPCTSWLPSSLARDEHGFILTGDDAPRADWPLQRRPCALETSLPRLLAAGDLRAGSTKRVGFAVGDGSLAVTCVHRVLSDE